MNGIRVFVVAITLSLLVGDAVCGQSLSGVVPDAHSLGRIELDEQRLREHERLAILDHQFMEKLRQLSRTDRSAGDLDYQLRPFDFDRRKELVFHADYRCRDQLRCLLIFDPIMQSWPGSQPQTIVICDGALNLLSWREVGGSPCFQFAELKVDAQGNATLNITRSHREMHNEHGLKTNRGKYTYTLADDKIVEVSGPEWIYFP